MKSKKPHIIQIDNFETPVSNSTHSNTDISLEIKEAHSAFLKLCVEINKLKGKYDKRENALLNNQHKGTSFWDAIKETVNTLTEKITQPEPKYDLKSIYYKSCKVQFLTLQREAQEIGKKLSFDTNSSSQDKILTTYTETNKQLAKIKDLIEALHTSPNLIALLEQFLLKKEAFETLVKDEVLVKDERECKLFEDLLKDFNTIINQQTFIINATNNKLIELEKLLSADIIEKTLKEMLILLEDHIIHLEKLNQNRKSILEQLPEDDLLLSNNSNHFALTVKEFEEDEQEEEIEIVEIPLEEEEPTELLNEKNEAEIRFTTLFQNLTAQVHNVDYLESSQSELKDIKLVCFDALVKTESEKATKEAKLTSDIETYNSAHAKLEKLEVTVARKIRDREALLQRQLESEQKVANEELDGLKAEVSNIYQLIDGMFLRDNLTQDDQNQLITATNFCKPNNTIGRASLESIEIEIEQKRKQRSAIRGNLKPLLLDVGTEYNKRQETLKVNIESFLGRIRTVSGFPIETNSLTGIQTSLNTLTEDRFSVTLNKITTLKNLEDQYGNELQRINAIISGEENKRQQSPIISDINELIQKVENAKTSINDDTHPAAVQLNTFKTELTNARDSYTALSTSLVDMKNHIKTEIDKNLTPATLGKLTTKDVWMITKICQKIMRWFETNLGEKPEAGNLKISMFANQEERDLAQSTNRLCLSLDSTHDEQERPEANLVF